MRDDVRIVSSAEAGAFCPDCGLRREICRCRANRGGDRATPSRAGGKGQRPPAPNDGVIRLFRDSKRRRGKTVTVVEGVPGGPAKLDDLATTLKRFCGAGGGVVEGAIEIQGDHRDKLLPKLTELGFRVKLAGG